MAMIRCGFLEVHVDEEMFADFRDVDGFKDVGEEFVEQENRWKGVGGGRGRAQGRGTGLGHGNAVDRNPTNVDSNAYDAQPPTWDFVNLGL